MVDIAHFPSTYRDISWRQVWNLKKTNHQVLTSGNIHDPSFHIDVQNWHSIAIRLNASVHAPTTGFQKLRELFTLQLLKKWVLRIILPVTLSDIAATISILQQHITIAPPPRASVLHTPNRQKALSPLEDTLLKVERYFTTHRDMCFSDPHITLAMQSFLQENPTYTMSSLRSIIEVQISEYFDRKIASIRQGLPTPIGRLFHATHLDSIGLQIMIDGKLKQSTHGVAGPGVYFSTQHEERGYGPICFSMDPKAVERSSARYFPAGDAVWMAVRNDVAIHPDNVSHIVVSSPEHERRLKELLFTTHDYIPNTVVAALSCQIIYSPTNHILMKCFYASGLKVLLPSHWTRNPNYSFSLSNTSHAQEAHS